MNLDEMMEAFVSIWIDYNIKNIEDEKNCKISIIFYF